MKRIILIALIFSLIIIIPTNTFAAPPEFAGGVNNEYEYEEIVFITGEPIKFIGTIRITENDKIDTKTIRYRMDLTPEDKSIEGKLSRSVSYIVEYDYRDDKGQTIGQMKVNSYSETIDIKGDKFTLKDYQFSKSDIIDNRPSF